MVYDKGNICTHTCIDIQNKRRASILPLVLSVYFLSLHFALHLLVAMGLTERVHFSDITGRFSSQTSCDVLHYVLLSSWYRL